MPGAAAFNSARDQAARCQPAHREYRVVEGGSENAAAAGARGLSASPATTAAYIRRAVNVWGTGGTARSFGH